MAEVKLFKQNSQYEKDGETKTATNFFVQCGDLQIPIEIKYFENKETGRDNQYLGRKMVLSSYAEELPAKEKVSKAAETVVDKPKGKPTRSSVSDDDGDIPF